jgi:signal peptidase I
MNDYGDTRGREMSESGGYARPGPTGDQQFGPAPGDGANSPIPARGPFQPGRPAGGVRPDGSAGGVRPDSPAGGTWPDGTAAGWQADGSASDQARGWGETAEAPGVTSGADEPGVLAGDEADDGDGFGLPGPRTGRRRPGKRRKRRKAMSWWVELPILLVFALVLALLIKSFVVQAFFIPSSSMENTLEIGDKVLVNKLVYDFRPIHRGDIVVFNGDDSWNAVPAQSPPLLDRLWNSISGLFGTAPGVHDYIKRVIGIPGDHVKCCNVHGQITVNGVPLTETSYLYPGNPPSTMQFNIVVPPGRLWVMGDHRSVSWDSRGHMTDPGNGTIPVNHVVGRAFVIVAPVSRWRVLPIPATFEQSSLNASSAALAAHPETSGLGLLRASGGSVLGALALPGAPAAAGLVAAVPLTLLQRRVRRRLARKFGPRPGAGRRGPG